MSQVFETNFTVKVNDKKQRRFDHSKVIFKLKVKFFYALKFMQSIARMLMKTVIKTLKYLHKNNTRKLRHEL